MSVGYLAPLAIHAMRKILSAGALAVSMLLTAWPAAASAAECWQGWGYWVDARTRAYKSEELLLVTDGAADWTPGRVVILRILDRATGRIDSGLPPLSATPIDPRAYYRGSTNYVGGLADIEGREDRLVFGLSHVAPPSAPIPELEDFTAWACGLASRPE